MWGQSATRRRIGNDGSVVRSALQEPLLSSNDRDDDDYDRRSELPQRDVALRPAMDGGKIAPGSPSHSLRAREGAPRVWQTLLESYIHWASWLGQLMVGARAKVLALGGSFASVLLLPRGQQRPLGITPLPPIKLTEAQSHALRQLQVRISAAFDKEREEHKNALVDLWQAAYPSRPLTPQVEVAGWKEMGWQGNHPASDFRGGGFLALQNLIHYARTYPASFQRIMRKQEGMRAEWEYPFCAAGVNVTVLLVNLLDLRADVPNTPAGRAFVRLLPESPALFDDLYCVTYEMLDARWLEMKASYMEFNVVLQATKSELEALICQKKLCAVSDLPAYSRLLSQ